MQIKLWDSKALDFAIQARKENKSLEWIRENLAELDYQKVTGEFYSEADISKYLCAAGVRKQVPRVYKQKPAGSKLIQDLQELLAAPLSDEFKERMARTLISTTRTGETL